MYANDKLYIPQQASTVYDGGIETGGTVLEVEFDDKQEMDLTEEMEFQLPNPVV